MASATYAFDTEPNIKNSPDSTSNQPNVKKKYNMKKRNNISNTHTRALSLSLAVYLLLICAHSQFTYVFSYLCIWYVMCMNGYTRTIYIHVYILPFLLHTFLSENPTKSKNEIVMPMPRWYKFIYMVYSRRYEMIIKQREIRRTTTSQRPFHATVRLHLMLMV